MEQREKKSEMKSLMTSGGSWQGYGEASTKAQTSAFRDRNEEKKDIIEQVRNRKEVQIENT